MPSHDLPHAPIKITPASGFSYIAERSLRECLGRRQFGTREMSQVVEWFRKHEPQPCCAFCGSPQVHRWDHLNAIRKDGETVIGNLVLSCQRCDDSKGQRLFGDWIRSSASHAPKAHGTTDVEERAHRLEAYMKAFDYMPVPLEKRLNSAEQASLSRIKAELERLRQEVETLIGQYQERTSST